MWPTENPWPCAILGTVVALVAITQWSSTRSRPALVTAGIALVIGLAAFVVDEFVQTPGEQVSALVRQMTAEFQRQDRAVLDHFSATAPELRALCEAALALVTVDRDLRVTDLQTQSSNNGSVVTSHFRANATVSVAGVGNVGHQPARFELRWQKEAGAWKVFKIRRLNPLNDQELPVLDRRSS